MNRETGCGPDTGRSDGRDTPNVPRIRADATVGEAARVLAGSDVGALLVVDGPGTDAAVVGLLTERDIFRALAAGGPDIYGHCVWVMVKHDFPGIDAAASPYERIRLFCERKVDHIALMDGFRVSGILNIWDCAGDVAVTPPGRAPAAGGGRIPS